MIAFQQDSASLSSLRDIIEPESISFWPLAPGWWVVAGVMLALIALLVRRSMVEYRRNAYRRDALAELALLDGDLTRLPALLKRTALGAFPRTEVASLAGEEWLHFLDTSGGTNDFTGGPGRGLITLAYTTGSTSESQQRALLACSRNWIRTHDRMAS